MLVYSPEKMLLILPLKSASIEFRKQGATTMQVQLIDVDQLLKP